MNVSRNEMAAAVIEPHFDAVRDAFCCWKDGCLADLRKIKFIVDPKIHNTPRHFAATRDDGLLMLFAPQFVDLPEETLVAILVHEFGHAADFRFPTRFITLGHGDVKAEWLSDNDLEHKNYRTWKKLWQQRDRDQVEQAADSIGFAVTGRQLKYGGDCMLQRFSGGVDRPLGLR